MISEQTPLALSEVAAQLVASSAEPDTVPLQETDDERRQREEDEQMIRKAQEHRASLIARINALQNPVDKLKQAKQFEILCYLISVEIKRLTVRANEDGGDGSAIDGNGESNDSSNHQTSKDNVDAVNSLDSEEEAQAKPQYFEELKEFVDTFNYSQEQNALKAKRIAELQSVLELKKTDINEKYSQSARDRRRVVLKSKHPKTGKLFDPELLKKFERTESNQMSELIDLTSKANLLKKRIGKLETAMKRKANAGDGLNMIDFEQLKIETQSLQEKIESRSAELSKLLQRKTGLVHSLIHSQLKLEHVNTQNQNLRSEQRKYQGLITTKKDKIPVLKKKREELRREVAHMKRESGLLLHKGLLYDFEHVYDLNDAVASDVKDLRTKYNSAARDKKVQDKLLKVEEREKNAADAAALAFAEAQVRDIAQDLMQVSKVGFQSEEQIVREQARLEARRLAIKKFMKPKTAVSKPQTKGTPFLSQSKPQSQPAHPKTPIAPAEQPQSTPAQQPL